MDLGQVAYHQADHELAASFFTRSLEHFRKLGNESHMARALNNLGDVAFRRGEYDKAHALLTESLALHRRVGDRQGIASTMNNLAGVANSQGDLETAMGSISRPFTCRRRGEPTLCCHLSGQHGRDYAVSQRCQTGLGTISRSDVAFSVRRGSPGYRRLPGWTGDGGDRAQSNRRSNDDARGGGRHRGGATPGPGSRARVRRCTNIAE